MAVVFGEFSLDRMVNAVEKVRQRLLRASAALESAGVPYAIAGGNAVALWVSRVDEAAVRNTQDVDVLLRRQDLDRAKAALESAGFVYRRAAGLDVFLDGSEGKLRDAVQIVFATDGADVCNSERTESVQVLSLKPLVRAALLSFSAEDRMNVQDMFSVGLIDQHWTAEYPPALATRLQSLLDDPNG